MLREQGTESPAGSRQVPLWILASFAGGVLTATAFSALADDAAPPRGRVVHVDEAPVRTHPKGVARVRTLASPADGTQHAFVAVLEMDAGAGVPQHRDPTEEYVYVLEGGGTITIDGQAHAIAPGHLVYMPADSEVSFQGTADGPTRVLQVFAPAGPERKYDAWTPSGP